MYVFLCPRVGFLTKLSKGGVIPESKANKGEATSNNDGIRLAVDLASRRAWQASHFFLDDVAHPAVHVLGLIGGDKVYLSPTLGV